MDVIAAQRGRVLEGDRKMPSSTKLLVAVGCLAMSLTAGAGIASAGPDMGPIINSTCSYPQVMAALTAQDPGVASQISGTPAANAWLKGFIAASPSQRKGMAAQAQMVPAVQQYTPLIVQVANTCNNF